MGFLDKLKQTVDSGIAKGMAYAEQVAEAKKAEEEKRAAEEAERKAAEEKAKAERIAAKEKAEAERLEREKKELETILSPSCDKGDCLWNDGKFYFTCPDDCECERKKYTKNRWAPKSYYRAMDFWPYMKLLEYAQRIENDKSIDYQQRNNTSKRMLYYLVYGIINDFFPNYHDIRLHEILRNIISTDGLSRNNVLLTDLLVVCKSLPEQLTIDKFYSILIKSPQYYDYSQPWFRNPSLYDRSLKDFLYTLRVFDVVSDKDKISKFFKDTSNISVDQLYDDTGRIKEAGRGGPEAGFYGDTIFNTLENWSGFNGENDVK